MTRADLTNAAHMTTTALAEHAPAAKTNLAAGLALAAVLSAFASLAWLFATGQIYALTPAEALALTASGHAMVLGAALRVGG